MKKTSTLLLCIVHCILLLGCSNSPKINRKIMPISTNGGISYGLYGMDGEIERQDHFQVNSGSAFQKIFSLGNLIETEREYKLLIFANYEQIGFSVDDRYMDSCYDFSAKPYEHIQFTITLPILEDGNYDLLFVVVKDPNNIKLDDNYRKQTDMSHLITVRYSLAVGKKNIYKSKFEDDKFRMIEDSTLDGVFLNQDQLRLSRLLSLNCDISDKPRLYLHIGNQSDERKKYAIILLYDWKQVPMYGNSFISTFVSPKSRLIIPFDLYLDQQGIHNLSAVCVEEPFQKVTFDNKRADFTIRVGINVENKECDIME